MTQQLPPEALTALQQLAPKTPRDFLPQSPAAHTGPITVEQAMQLVRNIAQALNNTSRMPITVTVHEDAGFDGVEQLVLRITPQS